MTSEELQKLIYDEMPKLEKTPNTLEYASKCKEAVKAAYMLGFTPEGDIPELFLLEKSWQSLAQESPYTKMEQDREAKYENPFFLFMSFVKGGVYPPPEIMLSLLQCFRLYMDCGGEKSLDEIFFGKPHKKKSSKAFEWHQIDKYIVFGINFHSKNIPPGTDLNLKGKSLVERAEIYLKWNNKNDTETDPESFLRGYRRWRKTVKK